LDVGFLRIEFAILTAALADFDFAKVWVLRIDSVDGVYNLPLEVFDGSERVVPSADDGVYTGMGRSMDNREPTDIGIGMFRESLIGLIGWSIGDTRGWQRMDSGSKVSGLTGDSV
jgi:hypothetical protein